MFDKAYVTKDIEQMKLDDRNFPNIIELGLQAMVVIYVGLC